MALLRYSIGTDARFVYGQRVNIFYIRNLVLGGFDDAAVTYISKDLWEIRVRVHDVFEENDVVDQYKRHHSCEKRICRGHDPSWWPIRNATSGLRRSGMRLRYDSGPTVVPSLSIRMPCLSRL
jgi:hypothetical protein